MWNNIYTIWRMIHDEQNNLVGRSDFRAVADELAAVLKRKMSAAGEKEPEILKIIDTDILFRKRQ